MRWRSLAGKCAILAFSTVFITMVCWITNKAMAWALKILTNTETIYITAFVAALIMPPFVATDLLGIEGLALASFVAIVSKFILAIYRKHIFNPVAIGVMASSLILDQPATWWVGGNMPMLPIFAISGLLILRTCSALKFSVFTCCLIC